MSNLDPRIELIRAKYELDRSAFWELPQKKGTWLVKHSALELVAAKAGIVFEPPMIIEANSAEGIAAVCVTGHMGDRAVWSIGEASPKSSKNAYPYAMAEKRAIDRVVLKLIGIHGIVYSEDEMSDAEPAPRVLVKEQREIDIDLRAEIQACATEEELVTLWRSELFQAELKKLKQDWQDSIVDLFRETKADRLAAPAQTPRGYVEPVFPQQ
jgi:hypothetical protein